MTLQAKLTLGTVLLVTIVVALISAVDLGDIMQNEFEHTLQLAKVVQLVAIDDVEQALNRRPTLTFPGALQTPELFRSEECRWSSSTPCSSPRWCSWSPSTTSNRPSTDGRPCPSRARFRPPNSSTASAA